MSATPAQSAGFCSGVLIARSISCIELSTSSSIESTSAMARSAAATAAEPDADSAALPAAVVALAGTEVVVAPGADVRAEAAAVVVGAEALGPVSRPLVDAPHPASAKVPTAIATAAATVLNRVRPTGTSLPP
jgi:hypothetical protein